jgi:hypothetical protein
LKTATGPRYYARALAGRTPGRTGHHRPSPARFRPTCSRVRARRRSAASRPGVTTERHGWWSFAGGTPNSASAVGGAVTCFARCRNRTGCLLSSTLTPSTPDGRRTCTARPSDRSPAIPRLPAIRTHQDSQLTAPRDVASVLVFDTAAMVLVCGGGRARGLGAKPDAQPTRSRLRAESLARQGSW